MKPPSPSPSSLEDRIRLRLRHSPSRVFSYHDFADLGTPGACRLALKRLCDSGQARRLFSGLYCRPAERLPMPEAIAAALARKFGWIIRRHPTAALDGAGASPSILFLSSGPYRHYDIAGHCIEFRHATRRRLIGDSSALRQRLHRLSERVKRRLPAGMLKAIHKIIPQSCREKFKDEVEELLSLVLMLDPSSGEAAASYSPERP